MANIAFAGLTAAGKTTHAQRLAADRERYHALLCNGHLIPSATEQESRRGIEAFAPVVHDAALAVLEGDMASLAELRAGYPREVLAIRRCAPAPRDRARGIHA